MANTGSDKLTVNYGEKRLSCRLRNLEIADLAAQCLRQGRDALQTTGEKQRKASQKRPRRSCPPTLEDTPLAAPIRRIAQADLAPPEHRHPVHEVFMEVANECRLEWCILGFIRKHLGILRVPGQPDGKGAAIPPVGGEFRR